MVKASEAMSARARARQAKAELDAQRAEQDRLIVDAATEFYEASEAAAAAQAALVAAEAQRTTAVARLVELGQTDTQVATLCGLGVKQVRDLRRRATPAPATPATTASKSSGRRAPAPVDDDSPTVDQATAAA